MAHRQLGDIDVAWDEHGDGDSVVLLHGLAEDRATWRRQQDALPARRTYAYDLRGHGETTAGDGRGTLAQLADDLIAFLENVSGPATCVGFSLGGTIVLAAAAARPDLMPRAIVIGTSSIVGRTAAGFYATRIAMARAGIDDAFRAALRDDTAAGLAADSHDLDALVDARLRAIGDGAGYINAAQAMARVHDEPLTVLLPTIPIHVDVVGGERDAFCPRKAADLLMAGLPDADYHELPGAGHLVGVDTPAALARLLGSLLGKEAR